MPFFKHAPKRDHNARAESAISLIQHGIHELYAAADHALVKHDRTTAQIDKMTVRAASLLDDHDAHATLADTVMGAVDSHLGPITNDAAQPPTA